MESKAAQVASACVDIKNDELRSERPLISLLGGTSTPEATSYNHTFSSAIIASALCGGANG
jgi:hypothetical protein